MHLCAVATRAGASAQQQLESLGLEEGPQGVQTPPNTPQLLIQVQALDSSRARQERLCCPLGGAPHGLCGLLSGVQGRGRAWVPVWYRLGGGLWHWDRALCRASQACMQCWAEPSLEFCSRMACFDLKQGAWQVFRKA